MHSFVYESAYQFRVAHVHARYLDCVAVSPPENAIVVIADHSLSNSFRGPSVIKLNL